MIPEHIAFIMDGNGRWAERRRLPRKYGHKMGTEALKRTIENCAEIGVKYVTFYAFSTENWNRPKDEVDYLFDMFRRFIGEIEEYKDENYRVIFIGNMREMPPDIREGAEKIEKECASKTGLTVCIAINYGSWEEITNAVNKLLAKGGSSVTKEEIAAALYTKDVPFPDLVVRTGGEIRLSNFLLLQSAYAELLFTKTLWPDFNKRNLTKCIEEFSSRSRKFGGLEDKNA